MDAKGLLKELLKQILEWQKENKKNILIESLRKVVVYSIGEQGERDSGSETPKKKLQKFYPRLRSEWYSAETAKELLREFGETLMQKFASDEIEVSLWRDLAKYQKIESKKELVKEVPSLTKQREKEIIKEANLKVRVEDDKFEKSADDLSEKDRRLAKQSGIKLRRKVR